MKVVCLASHFQVNNFPNGTALGPICTCCRIPWLYTQQLRRSSKQESGQSHPVKKGIECFPCTKLSKAPPFQRCSVCQSRARFSDIVKNRYLAGRFVSAAVRSRFDGGSSFCYGVLLEQGGWRSRWSLRCRCRSGLRSIWRRECRSTSETRPRRRMRRRVNGGSRIRRTRRRIRRTSFVESSDPAWRQVGLPYDANIPRTFINQDSGGGQGSLTGQENWYRLHFKVDPKYAGQKFLLES